MASLTQFLPQFQIGQRQLDRFAHRHGQLLPRDRTDSFSRRADETQQSGCSALDYQRHTQIAGLWLINKVMAHQIHPGIPNFMQLTAPYRPTVLQ